LIEVDILFEDNYKEKKEIIELKKKLFQIEDELENMKGIIKEK
jgi:hypothetical protein